MPAFPQVVGPSYQLASAQAAIERMVNWFLVPNEAPDSEGKFKMLALPCPGNAPFCALPVPAPFNQPNRGLLELRGRCFGVNGSKVFEIDSAGAFIDIGDVVDDGGLGGNLHGLRVALLRLRLLLLRRLRLLRLLQLKWSFSSLREL